MDFVAKLIPIEDETGFILPDELAEEWKALGVTELLYEVSGREVILRPNLPSPLAG